MKRILFLLLFPQYLLAQDASDTIMQASNLISLDYLAPGLIIERKLSANATTELSFGIYPSLGFFPDEGGWVYAFTPIGQVSYRYYVKYKNINRRSRKLISNSGNFVSPLILIILPVGWDNYITDHDPAAIGGVTYGWQRISPKRLYYNLQVGIGAVLAGNNPGGIEPIANIRLGYLLKYE